MALGLREPVDRDPIQLNAGRRPRPLPDAAKLPRGDFEVLVRCYGIDRVAEGCKVSAQR
jgi:hypothetical protein